jgi:hypothetical protein
LKPSFRGFSIEDDYFKDFEGITVEEKGKKIDDLLPKSFKMAAEAE